ncbi:MAG TPA: zf-HC2 domain-containing protein [Pyrinomonadaceae bacterium]|nr:zf-HC2 domain-containing protein [Pyrinomonadaceae bacterium]
MGETGDRLTATSAQHACVWADAVAVYLDGELTAGESFVFESHLETCGACPAALAEQRRLLGLLDAAVTGSREAVVLPEDFARVVTARAQSDMTRVRGASEKRRAALLALALAAAAFALIGAGGRDELFTPAAAVARGLAAAFEMALHSVAELAAGAALLLRGAGRFFTQARPDGPTRLVALAALACAVLLLLRLITKYHRTVRPD